MMSHRKARMGKSTDFGIPQVGKGDASRISNVVEFNKNFDEIRFSTPSEGFTKLGHRIVKKYGKT